MSPITSPRYASGVVISIWSSGSSSTARQRCHLDPAVAELALAAGLLLVAPLSLFGRGDRLAVGDLRLRQLAGRRVLPLEPRERDVEVPLAHAADHRLARVGDVLHGE